MRRVKGFDNDSDFGSYILGTGAAHHVADGSEDRKVVGHIYLPDPEARHFWREVYIRGEAEKVVSRPSGFKR